MHKNSVPGKAQSMLSRSGGYDAEIRRSKFNCSHSVKTTFNAGFLVPIYVDEMVPGDTFHVKLHGFARMTTLLFPIMDNMYMDTFFFFVPNRLLWTNWERFCGSQDNPGDSTDFLIPEVQTPPSGFAQGSLADYFGIPTKISNMISPNAFHFRAYNLIWNEWFRDENLQNSAEVIKGDGPDSSTSYTLLKRGKRHDYFTSCLPFPQKGPEVTLPLGDSAPVTGIGNKAPGWSSTNVTVRETGGNMVTYNPNRAILSSDFFVQGEGPASNAYPAIYADLSNATAANITQLREAFQLQRFYEKQARFGTRYIEVIRGHFGVRSPDARLQRPEYLGGGSTPVMVHPVAQTARDVGSPAAPLGDLGAYGVCAPTGHGFVYSATEHGVIVGLVSVRADLNYQSGLNRMWTRQRFEDYYWPVFAHLSEQPVLNQEIYAQGTTADDDVFGYQERYAEYRYHPSLITGLFRSNATGSLDTWHLAQDFATLPVLNAEFIQENPPMARVQAVTDEDDLKFDAFFSAYKARPMPVHSVPGWIDHF